MTDKTWKYRRFGEQAAIEVGSLAVGAGAALALSSLFNPVALGVAGAYGAVKLAQGYAGVISPALRKRAFDGAVRKGYFTPLDPQNKIALITGELSRKMDLETPAIYTVNKDFVIRSQVPLYLRFILPKAKIEKLLDKSLHKVFAAAVGMNTMLVGEQALKHNYSDDQLRFVVAHELSHLKAKDHISTLGAVTALSKHSLRALFFGSCAAIALSVVGANVITPGIGIAALGGVVATWAGTNLGLNFFSRIRERRTDRNALYVTRDLQGGTDMILALTDQILPSGAEKVMQQMQTHPMYHDRTTSMRTVFNEVAAYPPLKPAAVPQAKQPPPKQPGAGDPPQP